MEENKVYNNPDAQEEGGINLVEWFFKCLGHWYWFVISVVLCVSAAYVYTRFQTPQYNASATVLITEKDGRRSAQMSDAMMALQNMGSFSMTSSFENELEILKSRTLVKNVVTDLKLYINSYKKTSFGYDIPLYHNEPLNVFITPEDAAHFPKGARLESLIRPNGTLDVLLSYEIGEQEFEYSYAFDSLPAVIPSEYGVITLTKPQQEMAISENFKMITNIASPIAVARGYSKNLSVSATSKLTTIANISIKNSVKKRGVDFINKLVELYNKEANDEKNIVAQKTADFIDERILVIGEELESTDREVASFKQRSGLTDIESEAQLALQENSIYQQQFTEVNTQISLVEFLRDYVAKAEHIGEIIPSNVGLKDVDLSTVIDQYNALVIERKRLLLTSTESNPVVVSVTSSIQTMYNTVEATVASVLNGLQIRKQAIEKESGSFQSRISKAPEKEKEYLSIARQQEIKAALYITLLQKREENAITLSATANNGRIIAEAMADTNPVEPNSMMIMLVALMLGLCAPIAILYLRDLLKFKIDDRADVERITSVPVLSELPSGRKQTPVIGSVMVRENKNDMMEESFRALRTQVLFMLEKGQQVLLVTSSQPGEGKSFVTANLAVSLAYLGKKTLVIGADIRKPGLNKAFGFNKKQYGVSNYLNDPEGTRLEDFIFTSELSENLHILPGGTVPPNPTELV
ncbi:MAG: P-loop NTPase, partial [Bacteroidales bacterium]|nr:P-loop NTPase [Bacteroidales bacterium]